jgi:hypothetical protein
MLQIYKSLYDIDDVLYQVNRIDISGFDTKLHFSSNEYYVRVFDSINSVSGFITRITGNQKIIFSIFTTDAFGFFPGNVTITFGGIMIGKFENIDINNIIETLDPAPRCFKFYWSIGQGRFRDVDLRGVIKKIE